MHRDAEYRDDDRRSPDPAPGAGPWDVPGMGAVMESNTPRLDRHCVETIGRLAAEFSGVLPRKTVTETVVEARWDLEGQIVPEALSEMLHRLAQHRLRHIRENTREPGERRGQP